MRCMSATTVGNGISAGVQWYSKHGDQYAYRTSVAKKGRSETYDPSTCDSKNGRMFAVVALKLVTPPSRPFVLGHECPRSSTENPCTAAAVFSFAADAFAALAVEPAAAHALGSIVVSVVSLCGKETLLASLVFGATMRPSGPMEALVLAVVLEEVLLVQKTALRLAQSWRHESMSGVASFVSCRIKIESW